MEKNLQIKPAKGFLLEVKIGTNFCHINYNSSAPRYIIYMPRRYLAVAAATMAKSLSSDIRWIHMPIPK